LIIDSTVDIYLESVLRSQIILTCCDRPSPNQQYKYMVPITKTYRNAACATST